MKKKLVLILDKEQSLSIWIELFEINVVDKRKKEGKNTFLFTLSTYDWVGSKLSSFQCTLSNGSFLLSMYK